MQAAGDLTLDARDSLSPEQPMVGANARARVYLGYALELLVILAWTLVVARPLLNMDPTMMVGGREAAPSVQSHHLWTWVAECGWCATWNGSAQGGYPAFSEVYGSMLHPVVAITTLVWGVINGEKVALVIAFFVAGLAQWWLAYLLRLGWLARVWSACMVVTAGHLASRLDMGNFGLVLSMAFTSLVIPGVVLFFQSGTRRSAVFLAVLLALAALAGQGYLQFALLVTLPTALFMWPLSGLSVSALAQRLVVVVGLTLLLTAPFLLPALLFTPNVAKEQALSTQVGQSLRYVPLNLVLGDPKYLESDTLDKLPGAWIHAIYIGWIPVLLAIIGVVTERDARRQRIMWYLLATAFGAMWLASGGLLEFLARLSPFQAVDEFLGGFRFYPLMGGLAVPAILGLSAIGIDNLVRWSWPQLILRMPPPERTTLGTASLAWLLVVPLLLALLSARSLTENWMRLDPINPDIQQMVQALRTPDLQWVSPPFGELFWRETLVRAGLKLNNATMGWGLRDRPPPEPQIMGVRGTPPPDYRQVTIANGAAVAISGPGREYAAVTHPDQSRTVCTARGRAGNVDVTCNLDQPGILTVEENAFSGWRAILNGQPVSLREARWLSLELSSGAQTIEFRYRPWDVSLGLGLMVVGLALAAYLLWRGDPTPRVAVNEAAPS